MSKKKVKANIHPDNLPDNRDITNEILDQVSRLTPEQQEKIPAYIDAGIQVACSTTPCDRAKAEECMKAAYAFMKAAEPQFVWADSPTAGIRKAAELVAGTQNVTPADIEEAARNLSYGSFEAYWVYYYKFIKHELPTKPDPIVDVVLALANHVGSYIALDKYCILNEKPVAIHLVDHKLHNPNGLALEYKDGTGIFALDGVRFKSMLDMAISKEANELAVS